MIEQKKTFLGDCEHLTGVAFVGTGGSNTGNSKLEMIHSKTGLPDFSWHNITKR
jgi:hypothetical protein